MFRITTFCISLFLIVSPGVFANLSQNPTINIEKAQAQVQQQEQQVQQEQHLRIQAMDKAIAEEFPESFIGIKIQEAKSGKVLFQYNSEKAFVPASTLKVFTAATALKILGPEYQYKTEIKIAKNSLKEGEKEGGKEDEKEGENQTKILTQDLYIQFSGDPSLTLDTFKQFLKTTLENNQIKKITGTIILDDTRYTPPYAAYGWSWEDLSWYYATPITAIILNENKVNLKLRSNSTLNKMATIHFAEEESIRIPINNSIISVEKEVADKDCGIEVSMDQNNNASLKGCWPQNKKSDTLKLAIQNPVLLAKNAIEEVMTTMKIEWPHLIKIGKTPEDTITLNELKSETLSLLLKPLLRDSNNLYAETFFKTMGYVKTGQGSFLGGIKAVNASLIEDFGLKPNTFRINDGSGASRYNLITPNQLTQVLQRIYGSDVLRPIFWEALPKWGRMGTLKSRRTDSASALEDKVIAKTGGMLSVNTLAGYLTREGKEDLIFVIMFNNTLAAKETIHHFQELLLNDFR